MLTNNEPIQRTLFVFVIIYFNKVKIIFIFKKHIACVV